MAEIVLYFGSFNPIHKGHTAVARYVVDSGICDRLWFVVSPQNPLKPSASLARDHHRLEMARIAVADMKCGERIEVCDVEFSMPKPSYTIDTLEELSRRFAQHSFSILMGTDIMEQFDRWKQSEKILRDYRILVYPRDGFPLGDYKGRVVYLQDAPRWNYSSTQVRRALIEGLDVSDMLDGNVLEYIKKHKIWI